ncbi:hypothetical protein Sm713_11220 [Streptomyces sp. TS71-3]|nr:hypothetical protein Sm713_11220 [Streptomyces sp. TS71-3]
MVGRDGSGYAGTALGWHREMLPRGRVLAGASALGDAERFTRTRGSRVSGWCARTGWNGVRNVMGRRAEAQQEELIVPAERIWPHVFPPGSVDVTVIGSTSHTGYG